MKGSVNEEFYKVLLDNLNDGVYFVDRDRRITYWSRGAEKISGYASGEVVGRHCSDNILIHINGQGVSLCKAACPLEESIGDGQLHETEAYLHHKDGHRVPVLIRTTPIKDSGGKVIGAVEVFSDISLKEAYTHRIEELQRMAIIDHLTGVANRRYIEMNLEARLSETERYGWPFGVLFIDIDHFKRINDVYGHAVGDQVLKMVAQTLINNSRPFDTVGRWGGEEFLSVVFKVTEGELYAIADRLRILVGQSSISVGPDTVSVTVSIGATLVQPQDTIETILKRVDQLMYKSKRAGRNRVSVAANR